MKPSLPIVPHKAVAEISKIGNLLERWVVVTHGCQSEPTEGSTGGWISESLYFSISLSLSVSFSLSLYVSLSLPLSLSISIPLSFPLSLTLYLSICLSVCLSACLPACLSISLSLSIYLPTYLSIYLSTVSIYLSLSKQFCETSSKSGTWQVQDEASLRDFLLKFEVGDIKKRSKSVRLPSLLLHLSINRKLYF